MLAKKIIKWLRDNEETLLPEVQKEYKEFLLEQEFDEDSAFVDFMSQYSYEIYGSEGHLFDVVADLMDYTETGVNYQMHNYDEVPVNYITLTDDITEYYLLYNRNDDSVILIEGANTERLLNNDFDKKWNSFNDFLIDFLEIGE